MDRARPTVLAAVAALAAALLAASMPTTASAATTGEGTLDTSFSTDGKTTFKTGTVADDFAETVVPLPDGRMYVVGWQDGGSTTDGVVVRLRADGSLDSTFGSSGRFVLSDPAYGFEFRTAAAGPSGTLVLGGYRQDAATNDRDYLVVRLTSAGKLDTTFDFDGKVITGTSNFDSLTDLLVESDGRIVYVGTTNGTGALIRRLMPNGSPDGGFLGGTGLVLPVSNSSAQSVARLADGRYVVAVGTTTSGNDSVLVAVKDDATVDSTFGTSGIARIAYPTDVLDVVRHVGVDRQGRLVTVGMHFDLASLAPSWRLLTQRFSAAGQPDTTLGGTGWAVESSSVLGTSDLYAAALDGQGRPVAVVQDGDGRWRVVRLTTAGALDTTFSGDGIATLSFGTGTSYPGGLGIGRNGRIVAVGGYFAQPSAQPVIAVARYIGDRTPPKAGQMGPLTAYATSGVRTVSWSATDDNTGIASYAVRYRSASATSSTFGSYTTWKSATTAKTATFEGANGRTYCFSARGKDRAANVGPYGAQACVTFPVDDRGLARAGSWSQQTGSNYYRKTVLRSTTAGASLSFAGADYRELGLVVTTCDGCGTVKVFRGTTLLKTVSLQSATTVGRVVITIDSSSTVKSGTITIRQASGGKPVLIDGLVVGLVRQV